ncbi:signal peptidase I [Bacillus sp. CGMCC 1.16607]|uniref:signal peptidase I n=1 Tax=Bacillus sp. CGMCC 1.16607 TaxID=3351842 RepID=UPI003632AC40
MELTQTEVGKNESVTSVKKNSVKEWIKFVITLVVIYLVVTNCIGITRVSGHSMDPTLKDGSFLFVNKLSTFISKPSYGDVVIVEEGGYQIVKRVIGIPGDVVAIQKGVLYVNNMAIPEVYALGTPNDMEPVVVEKGYMFIMGDNRTPGESLDSRDPNIGPQPDSLVKGYAKFSIFPFYKIMKPLEL